MIRWLKPLMCVVVLFSYGCNGVSNFTPSLNDGTNLTGSLEADKADFGSKMSFSFSENSLRKASSLLNAVSFYEIKYAQIEFKLDGGEKTSQVGAVSRKGSIYTTDYFTLPVGNIEILNVFLKDSLKKTVYMVPSQDDEKAYLLADKTQLLPWNFESKKDEPIKKQAPILPVKADFAPDWGSLEMNFDLVDYKILNIRVLPNLMHIANEGSSTETAMIEDPNAPKDMLLRVYVSYRSYNNEDKPFVRRISFSDLGTVISIPVPIASTEDDTSTYDLKLDSIYGSHSFSLTKEEVNADKILSKKLVEDEPSNLEDYDIYFQHIAAPNSVVQGGQFSVLVSLKYTLPEGYRAVVSFHDGVSYGNPHVMEHPFPESHNAYLYYAPMLGRSGIRQYRVGFLDKSGILLGDWIEKKVEVQESALYQELVNKAGGEGKLDTITEVDYSYKKGIQSLEHLYALKHLKKLILDHADIKTYDQLDGLNVLIGLTHLSLEGLPFSSSKFNLNVLDKLTNLKFLSLKSTKPYDLDHLIKLVNLEKLNLMGNELVNVNFLSSMKALTYLNLSGNKLEDIKPLTGLSHLLELDLTANFIEDPSPIISLSQLKSLSLSSNTGLSDISSFASPDSKLMALETLNLDLTAVKDLAPLSTLSNLKYLYVAYTSVTDVSPLSALTNLVELHVQGLTVTNQGTVPESILKR